MGQDRTHSWDVPELLLSTPLFRVVVEETDDAMLVTVVVEDVGGSVDVLDDWWEAIEDGVVVTLGLVDGLLEGRVTITRILPIAGSGDTSLLARHS
jgi:hypothetical protein